MFPFGSVSVLRRKFRLARVVAASNGTGTPAPPATGAAGPDVLDTAVTAPFVLSNSASTWPDAFFTVVWRRFVSGVACVKSNGCSRAGSSADVTLPRLLKAHEASVVVPAASVRSTRVMRDDV